VDKNEFVRKAPEYYALGIAIALSKNSRARTIGAIESAFSSSDYFFFQKTDLVDEAFKILARYGVVSIVADDFGPTMFRAEDRLSDWTKSETNPITLFGKFKELGDVAWLRSAIRKVNDTYDELQIEPADFDQDALDAPWEPIPIERSDQVLAEAMERVQDAIKSIEQDNGYAANAPGERQYVLANLKAFQNTIAEQLEIYWLQIKTFALEPLGRVITRFGAAAVGIAATAAKDAIIEWLKTAFSKAIDWL
jgi:hypothetical protein